MPTRMTIGMALSSAGVRTLLVVPLRTKAGIELTHEQRPDCSFSNNFSNIA